MSENIRTARTTGHDESNLNSGKGSLETALEVYLREHNPEKPQLFRMRAQLPKQGRGSALLAATDRMWVSLKTYAEGGENTLHAHTNEDHIFVVLQGRATFYGPGDEGVTFTRNEGILLPCGCTYYFHAEPGEALVLLRVGCLVDPDHSPWGRVGGDGKPLPGSSKENRSAPTEFSDSYYQ